MRLIQFEDRAGQRRVGVVEGAGIQVVRGVRSTRELGLAAIRAGSG
ncbi:FAH family protein, partial [Pseudomonas aeruginosa]|nr:FAH family protein [Pseudomonas aeruginosa]